MVCCRYPPGFQSCLWKRFPPVSFLSGSVPSRHLLGAVAVYYRESPQYSIVQKLLLGKYFPHPPGFQSCLWKRYPPVSFLSGSVPSRHFLGAVALYYRGFPQYSIIQKLFLGKYFPPSPGFQSCLWKRFPPVSFLSGSVPSRHLLGAVAVYCRGSLQYSIVQKLFLGKYFPHPPGYRAVSGSASPPRVFSRVRYRQGIFLVWRCTKLLPEVSSVFDRTETALGEIFSTSARLPELSLEALPPREPSLGFGTSKASFSRSTKLPPDVSPVLFSKAIVGTVSTLCAIPHALSRENVITELSLRPIVDCRVFCNSFDAHAGWLRDRRGAQSLNLLFCRLPIFNVDKQLDMWDVWAETWG